MPSTSELTRQSEDSQEQSTSTVTDFNWPMHLAAKRSPFMQLGRDIFIYAPTRLIPSLIGFLSVYLYTRLLAPKEYGELSLVVTTVSFVNALAFNWTGYVLTRYFDRAKNNQNLHTLLSTLFYSVAALFVIVSVMWLAVIYGLQSMLEPATVSLFRLGVVSLGMQTLYGLMLAVFLLDRQSLKYNLHTVFNAIGGFLLSIGLISLLSFRAEAILWGGIIVAVGSILFDMYRLVHRLQIYPHYFSFSLLKQSLSFGLPQVGVSVFVLVLSVFDRYLIEGFRGSAEVGIYSASYKVAEMSILLPLSIVSLVAAPLIVRTFENQGQKETQVLLTKIFALYFVVFTPVTLIVVMFSRNIVSLVLGDAFVDAAVILPPVVMGVFFFGFSQFENMPFQLKEKPKTLLYLISAAGIINILLNLILIPSFGGLGAAWATFFSYATYVLISFVYVNRLFEITLPNTTVVKVVIALLAMLLVLVLGVETISTVSQLVLWLSTALVTYVVVLATLREQIFVELTSVVLDVGRKLDQAKP